LWLWLLWWGWCVLLHHRHRQFPPTFPVVSGSCWHGAQWAT
jgi:hypothetical protein